MNQLPVEVRQNIRAFVERGRPARAAAREFGVNVKTVRNIVKPDSRSTRAGAWSEREDGLVRAAFHSEDPKAAYQVLAERFERTYAAVSIRPYALGLRKRSPEEDKAYRAKARERRGLCERMLLADKTNAEIMAATGYSQPFIWIIASGLRWSGIVLPLRRRGFDYLERHAWGSLRERRAAERDERRIESQGLGRVIANRARIGYAAAIALAGATCFCKHRESQHFGGVCSALSEMAGASASSSRP